MGPQPSVFIRGVFSPLFGQNCPHLGFANGWQPTIGMPLLPFYSHLKINHDLLVTAAPAQRNTGLWLARETAEKGENKQNCKIWDFIWRENGLLKLFLTLNCFLSHLKASPVGCDPSHTHDGKAPPSHRQPLLFQTSHPRGKSKHWCPSNHC